MSTPGLLDVRDISKSYRRGPEEVHAIRGVSFSLDRGEVVALFGPSGSGKSTLLNVLCGWETPDSGEMTWSDPGPPPVDRPWSDLAILPQTLGLIEELSVRENVELPIRLDRRPREDAGKRLEGFLSFLGLDHLAERAPAEISLGEQQRTALARALILQPRLLLADEPTGHQDAEWAKVVFRTLRLAAGQGTTCLIATHNPEAVAFVDRRLGIRDGLVREVEIDRAPQGSERAEPTGEQAQNEWQRPRS
jgi:putative ABC transport system ATP-binding protein